MTHDTQVARLDGFTEEELEVTRFALQQVAKRVMDRAAADEYDVEDLPGAAVTFHLASTLAGEFGVKLGEPAPSSESLEMAAGCIAEGDAPIAARMAAEAQAHPLVKLPGKVILPLGAHADVPVSPEEDARCDYTAVEYDQGIDANAHP